MVTGRWVFKLKKNRFGHFLKYKVRWVVHYYKQQKKLNYVETFIAMVKSMFYKYSMGINVKRGYRILYINVVIVFFMNFSMKLFTLNNLIFSILNNLFWFANCENFYTVWNKLPRCGIKRLQKFWKNWILKSQSQITSFFIGPNVIIIIL